MLTKLIGTTGFRRFTDFVSPAFFDVVPARVLFGEAWRLVAGYRSVDAFQRARDGAVATAKRVSVALAESPAGPLGTLDEAGRIAAGQAILRLYFAQLYASQATLLDLGARRWSAREDGQAVWTPGRGHVAWDPAFRRAITGMYDAFYGGGDLPAALEPLGLASAAPIFERHFGDGDQSAVVFSVEHFVASFHEVFLHCKASGIRLDAQFLPLGLYLATLYETLEGLGVPLDVRAAYAAACAPEAAA